MRGAVEGERVREDLGLEMGEDCGLRTGGVGGGELVCDLDAEGVSHVWGRMLVPEEGLGVDVGISAGVERH